MRRVRLQWILLAITSVSLTAAALPGSKPEEQRLSPERLQCLHAMVQRHMDLSDISGAWRPGL